MTETVWLKALNLLKEHGRTTGAPVSGKGCYCVGGAIAAAITGDPYDMEMEHLQPEVQTALHRFADHVAVPAEEIHWGEPRKRTGFERVYPWNDAPDRTNEEVYKALQDLHELEVASAT